jgi:diguanylate cyclase (GGDEF)-like protein/PAS domain S-box-containing protein
MAEKRVTKTDLLLEINALRQKVSELEQSNADLKAMEDALRKSHERLSALFDRSLDCVYELDFEGRVIDANPAALKLFGYDRADLPSLNIASLFDGDQLTKALKRISAVIKAGVQNDLQEYMASCKDGTYVDIETKTSIIYHEGKPHSILGVARDITERKRYEEQLEYFAIHDQLTGLLNRHSLGDILIRTIAKAKRGAVSSLLYMDLDNFKGVNDTVGHSAGDKVLITLADLLKATLRAEDIVFRLGGDEFAVLLDGMNGRYALPAAERIRAIVEAHRFELEGRIFLLSLSIGLTEIDGILATGKLLSQADAAMYRAKAQGKNRVVMA